MPKEYNGMKEEIKKIKKDLIKFIEYFSLFIKQCDLITLKAEKIQKGKI